MPQFAPLVRRLLDLLSIRLTTLHSPHHHSLQSKYFDSHITAMNVLRACCSTARIALRGACLPSVQPRHASSPLLPLAVLHQAKRHFAMINGNQVRVGNVLEYKGKLVVVRRAQAVKPGKGGAFNQVELKDIRTGTWVGRGRGCGHGPGTFKT